MQPQMMQLANFTIDQQLIASMDLFTSTKAAIDGGHGGRDAAFFSAKKKADSRSRAKGHSHQRDGRKGPSIHSANESFTVYMRMHAAKRRLVNVNETRPAVGAKVGLETVVDVLACCTTFGPAIYNKVESEAQKEVHVDRERCGAPLM
jgi:hypothetical protein